MTPSTFSLLVFLFKLVSPVRHQLQSFVSFSFCFYSVRVSLILCSCCTHQNQTLTTKKKRTRSDSLFSLNTVLVDVKYFFLGSIDILTSILNLRADSLCRRNCTAVLPRGPNKVLLSRNETFCSFLPHSFPQILVLLIKIKSF